MEEIPAPIIFTPLEDEKIIETEIFEVETNYKTKLVIKITKSKSKIIIEGKNKDELQSNIFYSENSINELKKFFNVRKFR